MDRYESLQPSGVWEIDDGWDVFGVDGEKIGVVHDVQPHYVVVAKGFFFPTERFVPVTAITNVENDRVFLNVTKAEIDARGWDEIPDEDAVYSAGVGAETNERLSAAAPAEPVASVLQASPTTTVATTADTSRQPMTDNARYAADVAADDGLSAPEYREELQTVANSTTRVDAPVNPVNGDTRSLDGPLSLEQIHIERQQLEHAYVSGGTPSFAFEESQITIPILGESVEVFKRVAVREQVDISKVIRERNQRVTDTVRRERVIIDRDDRATTGMSVDTVTGARSGSGTGTGTNVVSERDFRP